MYPAEIRQTENEHVPDCFPICRVAARLDVEPRALRPWGQQRGQPFMNRKRKKNKNNHDDIYFNCVNGYCHECLEGCHEDTDCFVFYKVKNTGTGQEEKHPQRVWNHLTKKDNFQQFKDSIYYANWKKKYPNLNIGKRNFWKHVCKCVRRPTPHSCVDLHLTGLDAFMTSIRTSLLFVKEVKEEAERYIAWYCKQVNLMLEESTPEQRAELVRVFKLQEATKILKEGDEAVIAYLRSNNVDLEEIRRNNQTMEVA